MPSSLKELVVLARQGDKVAQGELWRRYLEPVALRMAMRVAPELAEDVVQQTSQLYLEHVHKLREPAAVRSWIRKVVRSAARQVRANDLQAEQLPEELDPVGSAPSPCEQLLQKEQRQMVRKAVGELPQRMRFAVEGVLRGQSVKQISRALACSEGTVKSLLFHARKRLRRHPGLGSLAA